MRRCILIVLAALVLLVVAAPGAEAKRIARAEARGTSSASATFTHVGNSLVLFDYKAAPDARARGQWTAYITVKQLGVPGYVLYRRLTEKTAARRRHETPGVILRTASYEVTVIVKAAGCRVRASETYLSIE